MAYEYTVIIRFDHEVEPEGLERDIEYAMSEFDTGVVATVEDVNEC